MHKGPQGQKRPANPIGCTVKIAKIAPGEIEEDSASESKDKAAQSLGHKGGKARAAKLTAEQRSEIAQIAAQARWRKSK